MMLEGLKEEGGWEDDGETMRGACGARGFGNRPVMGHPTNPDQGKCDVM